MATIKIKFRSSSVNTKEGCLYYQVIHARVARQISTGYKLYPTEWDYHSAEIILPLADEGRNKYLLILEEKIREDFRKLERIITILEQKKQPYTADDVVAVYTTPEAQDTVFVFMERIIKEVKRLGKIRMSEVYATTLNNFTHFRKGEDLPLKELNSDLMIAYEAYLKERGVCRNSSSFYMRNLRAVYNRAVEKELTPQQYPFKHVYTGIDKTVKRAVSLKEIRQIKELDLSLNFPQEYSRDLFLFSFYTRGMSFIDMAFLKKKDLSNGILTYRRKKTGQQLFIRWERCMQEIIVKYNTADSPYLLPIIKSSSEDERKQYSNAGHLVNRHLKGLGKLLELSIPLTMYVARHAWASIAKNKNVPVSVISEGLGHDSETTTQIYLTSLDTSAIDKANRLIIKSL